MARPKITNADGKKIFSKIRSIRPFIIGSLTKTRKLCGRPSCPCATKSLLHETTLLTWKEDGKTKSLYISKNFIAEVEKWIAEGRKLKDLMAQMSETQRMFMQSRKSKKTNN